MRLSKSEILRKAEKLYIEDKSTQSHCYAFNQGSDVLQNRYICRVVNDMVCDDPKVQSFEASLAEELRAAIKNFNCKYVECLEANLEINWTTSSKRGLIDFVIVQTKRL